MVKWGLITCGVRSCSERHVPSLSGFWPTTCVSHAPWDDCFLRLPTTHGFRRRLVAHPIAPPILDRWWALFSSATLRSGIRTGQNAYFCLPSRDFPPNSPLHLNMQMKPNRDLYNSNDNNPHNSRSCIQLWMLPHDWPCTSDSTYPECSFVNMLPQEAILNGLLQNWLIWLFCYLYVSLFFHCAFNWTFPFIHLKLFLSVCI